MDLLSLSSSRENGVRSSKQKPGAMVIRNKGPGARELGSNPSFCPYTDVT